MRHLHRTQAGWGFLFVCLLVNAIMGALLQPPVAYAVLPPRPTVPLEEDHGEASTPAPLVAQIALHVESAAGHHVAVVQWQGGDGQWHDVEGWKGDTAGGTIMWWVEEKDFGKGPFRWALYPPEGSAIYQQVDLFLNPGAVPVLATSQPFALPAHTGHQVTSFVSLRDSHSPVIPVHDLGAGSEALWHSSL